MQCPSLADLPPPPEPVTIWPWTRGSRPLPAMMPDGEPWPLISVVTPSFNQGRYLEQAIRSVLLQGYPRLEFIIIDGGSSDDSIRTIARYETWLKHWVSEPDAGPEDAMRKGFRAANGDIFAFLNADDFYLPGCLEKVAAAFRAHPSADVVSGHGYFVKASGELGVPVFSDPLDLNRFRNGACVLVQQATFFRRHAYAQVCGVEHHTSTCWDAELWADMALAGASFRSMDEFIAAFRLHTGSITGASGLRQLRGRDAAALMQRVRGRPDTLWDPMLRFLHRARKFSGHPLRTFRQRLFIYHALGRWSL